MRLYFLDVSRLRKEATSNVESGMAGLRRWWSRKYKLPPNHELFTSQNMGDLNLEMFEDWILRRKELEKLLAENSYSYSAEQVKEMEREINELGKALGEDYIEYKDELIDKWERELEDGLIPDLSEGLPNA